MASQSTKAGLVLVAGSICMLVLLCITFQNENFKYSLLNSDDDAKSSIEHTQAAAGNKELLKKMRSLLQVSISLLDDLTSIIIIIHDNLRTNLLAG